MHSAHLFYISTWHSVISMHSVHSSLMFVHQINFFPQYVLNIHSVNLSIKFYQSLWTFYTFIFYGISVLLYTSLKNSMHSCFTTAIIYILYSFYKSAHHIRSFSLYSIHTFLFNHLSFFLYISPSHSIHFKDNIVHHILPISQ